MDITWILSEIENSESYYWIDDLIYKLSNYLIKESYVKDSQIHNEIKNKEKQKIILDL